MDQTGRYRLHASLGYQLSLTSRLQERRFDDQLKALALTRITWCILLAVANEGLPHPSAIAAFVGIDRTAASRALRQMEAAGLIRRNCGRDDRRTTTVGLTPRGEDMLARATPLARENAAHFEAKLNEQDLADLHRLLARLRAGEDAALKHL